MFDQFKALIFDMDGTLVDSGQLHELAWSEMLTHYSLPIDRAYMRTLAGVPTKKTIELIIEKFNCTTTASLDEMNDFKEAVAQKNFHQYVKPTSLLSVVEKYHGKVPMSVGTGATTAEAKEILTICGLHDLVDHIVGADQVANAKPAPDTFLHCAMLMGVAPADCVVFEDAPMGLEAAARAGMVAVDVLQTFSIKNNYFL